MNENMDEWNDSYSVIQPFVHSISLKNSSCSIPNNFLLHSPCFWASNQFHRRANNFRSGVHRVSYKAQRFYQNFRNLSRDLIPELLCSSPKNSGIV